MEHPRAVFGAVRMAPGRRLVAHARLAARRTARYSSASACSPEAQARERLLNHYLTFEEAFSGYAEQHYQAAIEVGKVLLRRGHAGGRLELGKARRAPAVQDFIYLLSPKEILPHRLWRLVTLARNRLASRHEARRYIVVYFCEQPPDPQSRVYLGHEQGPARAEPADPRLAHPGERAPEPLSAPGSPRRSARSPRAWNSGAGHGRSSLHGCIPPHGHHPHGRDPRTGVVDPDCRVFGVRNLYIAGSAVFPERRPCQSDLDYRRAGAEACRAPAQRHLNR